MRLLSTTLFCRLAGGGSPGRVLATQSQIKVSGTRKTTISRTMLTILTILKFFFTIFKLQARGGPRVGHTSVVVRREIKGV